MEQIENISITITETKHKFYCDKCEAFLMESTETEDGSYAKPLCIMCNLDSSKQYCIEGYYCDNCREEKISELHDKLIELGFVLNEGE